MKEYIENRIKELKEKINKSILPVTDSYYTGALIELEESLRYLNKIENNKTL